MILSAQLGAFIGTIIKHSTPALIEAYITYRRTKDAYDNKVETLDADEHEAAARLILDNFKRGLRKPKPPKDGDTGNAGSPDPS